MLGKGLIKRSKQIQIIGQSIYLIIAIVLILLRFNLIAIVSAQALSIIVRRILSYNVVYTAEFKRHIHNVKAQARKEILKSIYPNAMKLGFTVMGGLVSSRSAIIIGSLYLSLDEMASYGITMQIIGIIATIGHVYYTSYHPKIAQCRIQNDNETIKSFYSNSCLLLLFTFIFGGTALLLGGEWALYIIGSKTPLLEKYFIVIILLYYFLEINCTISKEMLLTKNEVPFFKADLIAGAFTIVLLFIFLQYTNLNVWGIVFAPLIVQNCYSNWKWPVMVTKELNIKPYDIYKSLINLNNMVKLKPWKRV
jgi:O-antigen/teichoic acid export membrane protein